jgi:predicted type IV restriction endonuclease
MKYFAGIALVACLAGIGLVATAEDKPAEVTIQGEVVDLACWLEEGKMGPDHAKCAQSCVKGGTPAGIVTQDGSVYLVVVHAKEGKAPLDFVAQRVEVTGVVHERGGMKGIIASKCKKLEEKKPEGSGK